MPYDVDELRRRAQAGEHLTADEYFAMNRAGAEEHPNALPAPRVVDADYISQYEQTYGRPYAVKGSEITTDPRSLDRQVNFWKNATKAGIAAGVGGSLLGAFPSGGAAASGGSLLPSAPVGSGLLHSSVPSLATNFVPYAGTVAPSMVGGAAAGAGGGLLSGVPWKTVGTVANTLYTGYQNAQNARQVPPLPQSGIPGVPGGPDSGGPWNDWPTSKPANVSPPATQQNPAPSKTGVQTYQHTQEQLANQKRDKWSGPQSTTGGDLSRMEGYDATNWNNADMQTLKYQAGRIFSGYDPDDPAVLQKIMNDPSFKAQFPNARSEGPDKIDFGDGQLIDMIRGHGAPGAKFAWQWQNEPQGGGGGGAPSWQTHKWTPPAPVKQTTMAATTTSPSMNDAAMMEAFYNYMRAYYNNPQKRY